MFKENHCSSNYFAGITGNQEHDEMVSINEAGSSNASMDFDSDNNTRNAEGTLESDERWPEMDFREEQISIYDISDVSTLDFDNYGKYYCQNTYSNEDSSPDYLVPRLLPLDHFEELEDIQLSTNDFSDNEATGSNDISYYVAAEPSKPPESPKPGCSKDNDWPTIVDQSTVVEQQKKEEQAAASSIADSGDDEEKTSDNSPENSAESLLQIECHEKLQKDMALIHVLLPRLKHNSMFLKLFNNRQKHDYVGVTLLDLLSKETLQKQMTALKLLQTENYEKLQKNLALMHALLPRFEYNLILQILFNNQWQYANYVGATLLELFSKEMLEKEMTAPEYSDNISTETNTYQSFYKPNSRMTASFTMLQRSDDVQTGEDISNFTRTNSFASDTLSNEPLDKMKKSIMGKCVQEAVNASNKDNENSPSKRIKMSDTEGSQATSDSNTDISNIHGSSEESNSSQSEESTLEDNTEVKPQTTEPASISTFALPEPVSAPGPSSSSLSSRHSMQQARFTLDTIKIPIFSKSPVSPASSAPILTPAKLVHVTDSLRLKRSYETQDNKSLHASKNEGARPQGIGQLSSPLQYFVRSNMGANATLQAANVEDTSNVRNPRVETGPIASISTAETIAAAALAALNKLAEEKHGGTSSKCLLLSNGKRSICGASRCLKKISRSRVRREEAATTSSADLYTSASSPVASSSKSSDEVPAANDQRYTHHRDMQQTKEAMSVYGTQNRQMTQPVAGNDSDNVILPNKMAYRIYHKLIPMFPYMNTDYIKRTCQRYTKVNVQFANEKLLLQNIAEQLLDNQERPETAVEQEPTPLRSPQVSDLNDILMNIFPDADPTYLREKAEEMYDDAGKVNDFVQSKLENPDYPAREQYLAKLPDNQEQPETAVKQESTPLKSPQIDDLNDTLVNIFPNADPTYLREKAEEMYDDAEKVKEFVQSKLENPDYPTREQYLTKKNITEQQKRYTSDFNVQEFLEIFPDPFAHFENEKRQCQFHPHAVTFLQYHFIKITEPVLLVSYSQQMFNLSLTVKNLEMNLGRRKKRRIYGSRILTDNIPLLQEYAFILHRAELRKYLDEQKETEEREFDQLKARNELLECQCCYDNECMPSKCSTCEDGHIFCNTCIVRYTDVVLGNGRTQIDCLIDCGCGFPLSVLQRVLTSMKFSILLKKRQEEEVMAAGIEGLVSCPFCHFASIPPSEDKVFKCLNPDCMKESCRLCKKISHVPMTCDEEKTHAARLYLEERMTEALIRKCYNCGKEFIKEEGCNKMTCPCGATMCYICNQPVTSYTHFRGPQEPGSKNFCPLMSDDLRINTESVIKVCYETIKQIKEKNPNFENEINVDALLPKLPPQEKRPSRVLRLT